MERTNNDKCPTLLPSRQWWQKEEYTNRIKRITFIDNSIDFDRGDVEMSWDVSVESDNSIVAMINSNFSEVVIAGNGSGKIVASPSMEMMFQDFTSLERIDGIGKILDTSNVTNMKWAFKHCVSLRELDVSMWDVSNVIDFRGTFCCGHNQIGDAKITNINVSGWDVSNAKDMAYMFYGCGKLESINVTNWDVSGVTNFRHTFADCFNLKELDVSKWNTKSVVTLDGIFNDCRSLKSIDISSWDTSACMEFDQFFDNCISLEEIKGINKINTSNGISFEEMFYGCRKLKTLDLSSINTTKVDGHKFTAYDSSIEDVSNMRNFLTGCNSLKKLVYGPDFRYYVIDSNKHDGNQILEKLNELGYIIVSPVTGSMYPIVRPKTDHVVFKKKPVYKTNDIVLFQSENHKELVMHRIVRKFEKGYLIRGDNATVSEYIPNECVYAATTVVYHGNLTLKRNSLLYWLFSIYGIERHKVACYYHSSYEPMRRGARKIKRKLSAIKRRLIKRSPS